MKKRPSAKWIIVLAGGAAAAALSFLLAGIENEGVRGFRWALFAIGVAAAVLSAVVLVRGMADQTGRFHPVDHTGQGSRGKPGPVSEFS